MTIGLQLRRPGVYAAPPLRDDGIQPVRLDTAGFAGIALRGPVDTPTLVTRWSDFERVFGGFEGLDWAPERLLPYAVQAFFAQGGARAYVVRLAPGPSYGGPPAASATAQYSLPFADGRTLSLAAADEGAWGDNLAITLTPEVATTFTTQLVAADEFQLPPGAAPEPWTLVRVRSDRLPRTGLLRWVSAVAGPTPFPGRHRLTGRLDTELPFSGPEPTPDETVPVWIDSVVATMSVRDVRSTLRREETLTGLAFHPSHAAFLGRAITEQSSLLAWPGPPPDGGLLPPATLTAVPATLLSPGLDRLDGIDDDAFFDDVAEAAALDPDDLDDPPPPRGIDALAAQPDVALLCVPDLTWRAVAGTTLPVAPPLPGPRRVDPCNRCWTPGPPLAYAPLRERPAGLDPTKASDLAVIVARQVRLATLAQQTRRFVALLDVPEGLTADAIRDWRARFDTSFAAAYHPWLGTASAATAVDGTRSGTAPVTLTHVPPSAYAAGITASREVALGLAWGPANELARGAVLETAVITDDLHDRLHDLDINVFRVERDGCRLSSAHTLSSDLDYRQLSVRRLMTMIELSISRSTQWLTFEPNTADLRSRLQVAVTRLLRTLQRAGAFAGSGTADPFFVRCEDDLNPPESQALGRLVAEIGVAPARPIEYLVLRISQGVDDQLEVTSGGS